MCADYLLRNRYAREMTDKEAQAYNRGLRPSLDVDPNPNVSPRQLPRRNPNVKP